MTLTKDEALQKACKHLHSTMEGRLEIVDHISGCFYGTSNIDFQNSWIVYVYPEVIRMDGPEQYIVINKQTGIVSAVTTG